MSLPSANLLGSESSPYLRQHADNPVHWRAWSAEALAEARRLGKPILLSVGYAACHWCHVMAHQCFEDAEVAAVMNALFVNIKVDREERPDIDQIYMAALTAMGEQGGWPLTMFLTPDCRPFWGGTYFPKQRAHGRPGFIEVMGAVATAYRERRGEIDKGAGELTRFVGARLDAVPAETADAEDLLSFGSAVLSMIDPKSGGLRGAPKFPNAPFMTTLWLCWLQAGDTRFRDAVLQSLRRMLRGGIYDHIGGGLARYATDGEWLVPHFEKMLYDNAQLLWLLAYADTSADDPAFADRAGEIVAWLARDMTVEGGAFASSLDADSEGGEGAFYTWRREEIEAVLGPEDTGWFLRFHPLAAPPNWEGDPIITAAEVTPDLEERARLAGLRRRLLEERAHRPPPGRDDKVVTEWNGLMIAALATASRRFARPDWLAMAKTAFRAILDTEKEGRLIHSSLAGHGRVAAFSVDYAAMINAALALFAADPDGACLDHGRRWLASLNRFHADTAGTGYYLSPVDAQDVPLRVRGDADEATPSATAQLVEALARLALATGDEELERHAEAVRRQAARRSATQTHGRAGIANARAVAEAAMKLVISGKRDGDLATAADRLVDPRRLDIIAAPAEIARTDGLPKPAPADQAAAWLCTGRVCRAPITGVKEMKEVLKDYSR